MKRTSFLKYIVSLEFLFGAVLIALFFTHVGKFDWWWLVVLFPLVDLSAFGYLQNAKAGAYTYNLGHSLLGPAILMAAYITLGGTGWLFASLVWLFHIFVDRALGYGLKHRDNFHHTHLGKIGKAKRQSKKKSM